MIAALPMGEIVAYSFFPRPKTVLESFALFSDNWLPAGQFCLSAISYLGAM